MHRWHRQHYAAPVTKGGADRTGTSDRGQYTPLPSSHLVDLLRWCGTYSNLERDLRCTRLDATCLSYRDQHSRLSSTRDPFCRWLTIIALSWSTARTSSTTFRASWALIPNPSTEAIVQVRAAQSNPAQPWNTTSLPQSTALVYNLVPHGHTGPLALRGTPYYQQ